MQTGEIIIYQAPDGQPSIDVKLEDETVWLTQSQMQQLFQQTKQNMSLHIKNIYNEKELDREATVKESLTVQKEGKRSVKRKIEYYSLDVIISVGYRVKSQNGTQFRIWANKVLKNYLIKGYSINEKRLKEQAEQLESLKQAVKLLGNVIETQPLNSDEATGLLKVLTDYTYALDVLDRYDHQVLEIGATTKEELFQINYAEAMKAIDGLRDKFGGSTLFGNEKDESFQGSLAAIYQTFGGEFVYPSIEEKAANLLYFVIKNHSFSDGNKRIAAFLFVWFLEKNGILYKGDGSRKIADNALVALTLMIAESKPDEKDIMVKVVVNLINNNNQ
ncbi:MAG: virulence protein RhuM/Fic/DOC family protein [Chitinophagaceae bacterium]|nr:virulence protein RhuM/Fic/DOC family protein [Chitinophagaceae bacterium]MDP1811969.1 RhuM family protein [Sediminibacterium sp.]MDP3128435.1 RhuM family protein [Sediminibacterium sp.]